MALFIAGLFVSLIFFVASIILVFKTYKRKKVKKLFLLIIKIKKEKMKIAH